MVAYARRVFQHSVSGEPIDQITSVGSNHRYKLERCLQLGPAKVNRDTLLLADV